MKFDKEQEARQILIEAMKAQLEKPSRACVNHEACFVAQRLRDSGHHTLAARYWTWVCGRMDVDEFGEEIYNLQVELDKIDKEFVMPSWGTYGT